MRARVGYHIDRDVLWGVGSVYVLCLCLYSVYDNMIFSTGMCCLACCPSVCSVTHMRAGVGYYIHRDALEIQGVGSVYVVCRCLYSACTI